MIDAIDIFAFKCFPTLSLDLGQLTVLTGLNASGKSTVVQSLLLAHQASLGDGTAVPLVDGSGLDLGHAHDVLNVNADGNEIGVTLMAGGERHVWTFDTGPAGDTDVPYLQVIRRPPSPPPPIGSRGNAFTFLGAERLGPRTSYPTAPSRPNDAVVGEDGRFVAHALAVRERHEVAEGRRHPDAGNVLTLRPQAEAWLSQLVGPTQLEASLVPNTSLATLRIRRPGRMTEWMIPTNTGFGVSYSLPVVVAGLLAPHESLLIVDSPEAHLHPAAQSAMAGFLAEVAASGVQVIIETHSDHVLNGIRTAAAVRGAIDPASIRIAFFAHDPEPARLSITDRGAVSQWPSGFFDQFEVDLGELARMRRP
jgi:predicted ATPase